MEVVLEEGTRTDVWTWAQPATRDIPLYCTSPAFCRGNMLRSWPTSIGLVRSNYCNTDVSESWLCDSVYVYGITNCSIYPVRHVLSIGRVPPPALTCSPCSSCLLLP